MHGRAAGGGGKSVGERAIRQLVALTTGTASEARLKPIIGPPMI